MTNVPADWNSYYTTCPRCGDRYHLSEGGCDCTECKYCGEVGKLGDFPFSLEDDACDDCLDQMQEDISDIARWATRVYNAGDFSPSTVLYIRKGTDREAGLIDIAENESVVFLELGDDSDPTGNPEAELDELHLHWDQFNVYRKVSCGWKLITSL